MLCDPVCTYVYTWTRCAGEECLAVVAQGQLREGPVKRYTGTRVHVGILPVVSEPVGPVCWLS
jgi:hypothetical protein